MGVYAVDDATTVATEIVYRVDVPDVPPPNVAAWTEFQGGEHGALPVAAHPCYDAEVTGGLPAGATWDDVPD